MLFDVYQDGIIKCMENYLWLFTIILKSPVSLSHTVFYYHIRFETNNTGFCLDVQHWRFKFKLFCNIWNFNIGIRWFNR